MTDKKLIAEIIKAEKDGWALCVGCVYYRIDIEECISCPIATRKFLGLSPDVEDARKKISTDKLEALLKEILAMGAVKGEDSEASDD